MTYGLTPEGFVARPASDIKAALDAAYKGVYGDSVGSNGDGSIPAATLMGQEIGIMVDFGSSLWDLAGAVVSGFDPAQAEDFALDALSAITGTVRSKAAFSSVIATLTGTAGTEVPAGKVATVTGASTRFVTQAGKTLATVATAWATSTQYAEGDFVINSGKLYRCRVAGESAGGGGGPTGTTAAVIDNTVTWSYLGASTVGVADVEALADTAGPFECAELALTTIATPVAGWAAVNNYDAAIPGAYVEGNTSLRYRRDVELASDGGATEEAIISAVEKVGQDSTDAADRVTAVRVFANRTDAVNGDGVPAHSVEVLVQGGQDAAVAQAIFDVVGAAAGTYGNQTSVVTDSQGNTHTINWSRPTEIDVYIVATVYYDATKWPPTGAAALVQQTAISAILTFTGGYYKPGVNVRSSPLVAATMEGPAAIDSDGNAVVPAPPGSPALPGGVEVTPMYIGTAPAPGSSTPISIGPRQIASFDSSRVSITATPETP